MGKNFDILVDGVRIATERRAAAPEKRFVGVDYPLPPELTRGKRAVRVRLETRGTDAFVYELRTLGGAAILSSSPGRGGGRRSRTEGA